VKIKFFLQAKVNQIKYKSNKCKTICGFIKSIKKFFLISSTRIWQIPSNADIFPQQFSSHFANLQNQHFAAFCEYLTGFSEY
jgi:hypothetical protein